MKFRIGFVSNSSSSSFVVAIPHTRMDNKIIMQMEVNLDEMKRDELCNLKELDDYFLNIVRHWHNKPTVQELFEQYPNYKEAYDQYKQLIENGYRVIIGSADSDEDEMERYICLHGFENVEEGVKIIENCSGY